MYLALDTRLGVQRALKMIQADSAHTQMLQERLETEARAMARVQHPNILTVHDMGIEDDQPFVVMEYATRGSIADRLREGALPPRQACEVLDGVLAALGAAHDHGIVHRDVKPQNIVVTDNGTVKLMDFGIASMPDSDVFGMTKTGTQLGTLAYMSPEQRVDPRRVDARSDLYAVGATLCVLLTCRNPVDLHALDAHDELLEGIDPDLADVIAHATRYRAEDRFETAEEMAVAIRQVTDLLPPDPEDSPSLATWQASGAPSLPRVEDTDVGDSVPGFGPSEETGFSGQHDFRMRALPTLTPGSDPVAPAPPDPVVEPPVEPAPQPRRRPWPIALAIPVLALLAWWLWPDAAPPPTPQPVAPDPSAVAAPLTPPPEPPPVEVPPPEPTEPDPAPTAPSDTPPEPRPDPPTRTQTPPPPPPPEPEPTADPEPPAEVPPAAEATPTTATVRVTGDAMGVELIDGEGIAHPPGALVAGTYAIRAAFTSDGDVAAGKITLEPGEQRVIRCSSAFLRCEAL